MLGFAITGSAAGLIVAVILGSWLVPALLNWALGRRQGMSLRDALTDPGTLTFTAIVFVVLVCVIASTT